MEETKRAGLTGRPLLNTQGIVGSLRGSFVAGQRVTLINLRAISDKLAEAQRVMTDTVTEIEKAGDTIDDIKDKGNNLNKLIDYWEKWDRKGVHDYNAQIEFLSSAMQMDIVREMMLGEYVDPYSINDYNIKSLLIPRGFQWDKYFEWQEHDLNTNKDLRWLEIFGQRGPYIYNGLSLDDMLAVAITNVTVPLGLVGTIAALGATLVALITSSVTVLGNAFDLGPLSKASAFTTIIAGSMALGAYQKTVTKLIIENALQMSILTGISSAIMSLVQFLRLYKISELTGKRATDEMAAAWPTTIHLCRFEQYYTFFYFDQLVSGISIGIGQANNAILISIVGLLTAWVTTQIIFNSALAPYPFIPDLTTGVPPISIPNAPAVAAFTATVNTYHATVLSYSSVLTGLSTASVSTSWSFVFSFLSLFLGTVTRRHNNKPSLNSRNYPPSKSGPNRSGIMNNNENNVGDMMHLDCEGFIRFVGSMASILGSTDAIQDLSAKLSIGTIFNDDAYYAYNGSISSKDCYWFFGNKNTYWDSRNNKPGIKVATIDSIIGTGDTKQVFYGPIVTHDAGKLDTDIVCWSHVYDSNIFGFKPSQFGGRSINRTIVIKTRAENSAFIYRANICLCTFNGDGDNLYLLWERNQIRYKSGTGAQIQTIEQIIENFDMKNNGNLWTKRTGYLSEIWATTFDGHTMSYLADLKYRDNLLMGEFINREVTSFKRHQYVIPVNEYNDDNMGTLRSYQNPYA